MKVHSKYDVVTLGYIFDEHIEYPGKERQGPFLGATVSYASVCLGALGVPTGIVTNVGEDIPEVLVRPFLDVGVDTTGLNRRKDAETTRNLLKYDETGRKEIIYLSKAPTISFADIPSPHLSARCFCICPVDFEVDLATIRSLAGLDDRVLAADLGGLGGAHCSREKRDLYESGALGEVGEYLEHLTIAKASTEDCELIWNESHVTPESAAHRLLGGGVRIALVTLGQEGALIATKTETLRVGAFPCMAIDSTGAGDTFLAAFVAAYLESSDLEYCGRFASATAAYLVQRTGGVRPERFPSRSVVLEMLEGWENDVRRISFA